MEIIKGNPNYNGLLKKQAFTSIMNLYEVYLQFARDGYTEKGEYYYCRFKKILLEIQDEDIFLATKVKLKHKANNLSYVDALGYVMAIHNRLIFVTGDQGFKHMKNVEFVK